MSLISFIQEHLGTLNVLIENGNETVWSQMLADGGPPLMCYTTSLGQFPCLCNLNCVAKMKIDGTTQQMKA